MRCSGTSRYFRAGRGSGGGPQGDHRWRRCRGRLGQGEEASGPRAEVRAISVKVRLTRGLRKLKGFQEFFLPQLTRERAQRLVAGGGSGRRWSGEAVESITEDLRGQPLVGGRPESRGDSEGGNAGTGTVTVTTTGGVAGARASSRSSWGTRSRTTTNFSTIRGTGCCLSMAASPRAIRPVLAAMAIQSRLPVMAEAGFFFAYRGLAGAEHQEVAVEAALRRC